MKGAARKPEYGDHSQKHGKCFTTASNREWLRSPPAIPRPAHTRTAQLTNSQLLAENCHHVMACLQASFLTFRITCVILANEDA